MQEMFWFIIGISILAYIIIGIPYLGYRFANKTKTLTRAILALIVVIFIGRGIYNYEIIPYKVLTKLGINTPLKYLFLIIMPALIIGIFINCFRWIKSRKNVLIRRTLLTCYIFFCSFVIYFVGGLWYGFYQEHRSFAIGMKNVEGARVNAERTAKIYAQGEIERQGSKYEKEGKYDLAIEQYKKALAMKVNNLDEWVIRCALADLYAKSDQHELALEEVNWIIAQNPREEVKNDYIIRRQLLEKLVDSKKVAKDNTTRK